MLGSESLTRRVFTGLRRVFGRAGHSSRNLAGAFEEVDLATGEKRELFSSEGLSSKLLIVITTCNRARQLEALLGQVGSSLASARGSFEVGLLILEDAAEEDYAGVRRYILTQLRYPCTWIRSQERMGKRGYWMTYQAAFSYIQRSRAERILFLQDDLFLAEDFLSRAQELFCELKGEGRASSRPLLLNFYSSSDDEPEGRWVKFARTSHPKLPVRRTQWFDLNGYMLEREVLEALCFRLTPIGASRWEKDPALSSGVGQQLTRRLTRRADIFQCFPPLIFHGREPSVMNPEARLARSLDNYHLRGDVPFSEPS